MKDNIVIIDGNSLVNRAFYAIQRPMITKDGMYTQGIYGFLSMLTKIRSEYKPTHMLVAFDRKAPTFRHQEYADYKAGRKKMPIELAMEMPVLKEVLDALGIMRFEIDGFEADDIIGTTAAMAEEEGIPAFVITGDKDALQLATDKTSVIITKKGITDFKLYDDAAMQEEFGFDHIQFIDYKALRGDPSDNIPGVPGVGEKTAAKLIQQFGSIENIIAEPEKIENAKLRAKIEDNLMTLMMSKRLATIVRNVPVDYSVEDCRIKPQDTDRLIEIYSKLEFNTYLKKLSAEVRNGTVSESGNTPSGPAGGQADEVSTEAAGEVPVRTIAEDEIWISMISDDSHVALPSVEAFAWIDKDGSHTVSENAAAELADLLGGKTLKLCGFGLGRLYYVLARYGADISGLSTGFDCALAEYVLSPSAKAKDLDTLLLERYHYQPKEAAPAQLDMFSAQSGSDYSELISKLELMLRLAADQQAEISRKGLDYVFSEIELPLCKVLASMECSGIHVDRTNLMGFGKELKAKISALETEIYQLAGEEFNINSPKQLGVILFEKLGLPGGKKTKTGYSTNAEVLDKLAPEHPVVEKILEYRTFSKLNSTYVEGLLPLIDGENKIHAHFQQTVTATGRISCTEPNLQNIPVRSDLGRQLRKAFTSGGDDYVLVGADYSQIELRVLAHMSGDPTLIQCFNDGLDIHRETASKVFGVPQDQVTSQMRSNAKAVNFGVIYGMSGFGLATELTISRKQAEKYISDYFERFRDVKLFMDNAVSSCKEKGYSRTLFGRRRDVPEISASAYMVRQLGERLAMNTPIQGTAADIIKLAMIRVYDALAKECPGSELILQIHDELIIRARRDELEKVRHILRSCMETAAELAVRLEVSMDEGQTWFDLG